jgi:hypothetical protein
VVVEGQVASPFDWQKDERSRALMRMLLSERGNEGVSHRMPPDEVVGQAGVFRVVEVSDEMNSQAVTVLHLVVRQLLQTHTTSTPHPGIGLTYLNHNKFQMPTVHTFTVSTYSMPYFHK